MIKDADADGDEEITSAEFFKTLEYYCAKMKDGTRRYDSFAEE